MGKRQYKTIATGSIIIQAPSGEVWTFGHDWSQSTGETTYYYSSSKGYCSVWFRSPFEAMKSMYRSIGNAEKDHDLENKMRLATRVLEGDKAETGNEIEKT